MSSCSTNTSLYDGASIYAEPDEDGWAMMDPEGPNLWPTHQYDLDALSPTTPSKEPPAWLGPLQPLLPPKMAAHALGLHYALRAQSVWAGPLARRAGAVSSIVGGQALRGATHVATVGPPRAQRLAAQAWSLRHQLGDSVQDGVRWLWYSARERQVAEALYMWLEDYGYIVDGQLEAPLEFEMMTQEGVRRVPALAEITLSDWRRWCSHLQTYSGLLTPWGLAAQLRRRASPRLSPCIQAAQVSP